MSTIRPTILFCAIFMANSNLGAAPSVVSQIQIEPESVSTIPAAQRKKFSNRLRAYQNAIRSRRVDVVYMLLSDSAFSNSVRPSKTEFVERMRRLRKRSHEVLLEFSPRAIAYDEVKNVYRIQGLARVRYPGGVFEDPAFLYAHLERDNWYFSEVLRTVSEPSLGEDVIK